jgi:hypothetical protein
VEIVEGCDRDAEPAKVAQRVQRVVARPYRVVE